MHPLVSIPPRRSHSPIARAAFAMAQARARGADPMQFLPKSDEASAAIVQRASVSPGSTTTAGFGAELITHAWREFLIDLAPYSGAARLIAQAVRAKLTPETTAHYPIRTSGRKVPAWVGESGAIPVISSTFGDVEIGPLKKMAHIVVWTIELSKRSDAASIFQTMLREDVAAGLDSGFFAATAGSATAPAGLLYGVTATAAVGGSGEAGAKADLAQLAAIVAAGGSGSVTFIVNPVRLARLRIIAPDLANLDIVASGAVAVDRIIAVDGPSLLIAVDEAPDIYAADSATLHMSDVPLPISAGGVADPVRSLWQTGTTALRVIHEIEFTARRSGAVAFADGVGDW